MMKKENGNYQQGLHDNCHCRSHQPISIAEKVLSKYLTNHQSFRTAQQFRNDKFSYRWNEYQHNIFFTVSPSMIFYTLSSNRIETCGLCTRMLFLLFKHAMAEI